MFREFYVALALLCFSNLALAQAPSNVETTSENIGEVNKQFKEDLNTKLSQTREVFPKYLFIFIAFAIVMAGTIFLNRRGSQIFDDARKREEEDKKHEPQIDAFWPEPNRHKK